MMVRINEYNEYIYIIIVGTIPFLRSLFDIHSSINSIILYVARLYIGTLQNIHTNYNRSHNCLQRLCQHFLKASSPLHIRTKQKVPLLSATS